MTMTLIETITVPSGGVLEMEFLNIPQDSKDLLMLLSLRGTGSTFRVYEITINDNSGSIYTFNRLLGTGSSASSNGLANTSNFTYQSCNGSASTADTFHNASAYFSNYTSSENKTMSLDEVVENNATDGRQNLYSGIAADTNPITSIQVFDNVLLLEHSSVSLYSIS